MTAGKPHNRIMERYNVYIRRPEQTQYIPVAGGAVSSARGRNGTQPKTKGRHVGWLLSAAAHGLLLTAALTIARISVRPPAPEQSTVEMVFQGPAAATSTSLGPPAEGGAERTAPAEAPERLQPDPHRPSEPAEPVVPLPTPVPQPDVQPHQADAVAPPPAPELPPSRSEAPPAVPNPEPPAPAESEAAPPPPALVLPAPVTQPPLVTAPPPAPAPPPLPLAQPDRPVVQPHQRSPETMATKAPARVPVKNAAPKPRAARAAPESTHLGGAEPTATQPANGPSAARQDGAGAQQSSAPTIDSGWIHAISAWLAAHKTYPEQARARGDEGHETVRLTIDHQGHVTGLEVVRSSGSDILDEATATMLRGATLPALPPAMTQPSVTITVQIHYALTP